jgi:hypothetical protein
MRFACQITKATDTKLRICNTYCFYWQRWLRARTSALHLYVHCSSFWFLFWKTENPLYLTFLYLYARVLMTDLFLSGSSPHQQWSRRTTGRDSRTQGKAGRDAEMPAGDSKGPRQFTVCLNILQLLLYSDMWFLLFDHCMKPCLCSDHSCINGDW